MDIFAIVLSKPHKNVREKIEEVYPNSYQLNKTFFLVTCDQISERIAENVRIRGVNKFKKAAGVVFKLDNHYSGYAAAGIWEWLDKFNRRY